MIHGLQGESHLFLHRSLVAIDRMTSAGQLNFIYSEIVPLLMQATYRTWASYKRLRRRVRPLVTSTDRV